MSSLKERIKAADDIQSEVVHVPEWDLDVEVRGMDGRGRAEYMATAYDDEGKPIHGETLVGIVVATCYDPESGERLFDASDKEWLAGKSGAALNQLGLVGMRLSGITAAEKDDIKNDSEAGEKG